MCSTRRYKACVRLGGDIYHDMCLGAYNGCYVRRIATGCVLSFANAELPLSLEEYIQMIKRHCDPMEELAKFVFAC